MSSPTHVTIECRVTAAEHEALMKLLQELRGLVKSRVLGMRGIDVESAETGLLKLIERTETADCW